MEYHREKKAVESENRRMANVLHQLRNSILADDNRRQITIGKNYLQKYRKFIQVVDRGNSSLAEVEKSLNGNDQVDVAGTVAFLTVIMGDQEEVVKTVQVGNTLVQKTKWRMKCVATLRDYNGLVLDAMDFVATAERRKTNVSQETGFNPSGDLMEDLWKQVAERVGQFYTTELKFKVKGPKGDDEFDSDDATIYLDGKEVDGESVLALAINHEVRAEVPGYRTIKREVVIDEPTPSKTVKLNFKKEKPAPKAEKEAESDDDAE